MHTYSYDHKKTVADVSRLMSEISRAEQFELVCGLIMMLKLGTGIKSKLL
jgi:hypothetical protein